MNAPRVLVTGGTGVLGQHVVERLGAAGLQSRVLSRSGKPGTIRGDLRTGEGLEVAVKDVNIIIHCATSPFRKARQVDVEGTGRLLAAATRAGVSHIVYISIVGIDRAPSYPYYRIKLETERVVESSPVPHTILRATQFYDLVFMAMRFLDRLPVMPIPRGFLGQPIDAGEVAGHLVALSGPAGRVPDIGGPEVMTLADAARTYLQIKGRRRRIFEVPFPGKTARAFREGALVCPDRAYGKIRWEDFLRSQIETQIDLHGAEGVTR
ncbi:MAG TPA: NmrA family NAD(P)-binding protein [Rubrobacter sp.]|nr:NmrA family NAD(P)-binding protein [Rubrobacter sp.]